MFFFAFGELFLDFGLERFSFHFPWFSTIFLTLPCFPLVSLVFNMVFLHFLHFLCFCHWFSLFSLFSSMFLTPSFSSRFGVFVIGVLCFSVDFPAFSSLPFVFHWHSLLFHWFVLHVRHFFLFVHGFSLLSPYLSFVLLHFRYLVVHVVHWLSSGQIFAVAAAAAIASVALLVAVVIVVVGLRHDGFKNKDREGGWGGGRSVSPPRRWEGLDVASL